MSRSKGTANLAASLEVLAGAPLDAREKVPTKADLYLAANFPYPYVGLETYVVSENKKYRLIGNDVTVEANWQEVGSGGGGGTTVVANPEGEATDELEKLQVGNDIYSIPQGGSGADTEIIANDFDATESYAVGEYVVYKGTLYKCTTAHTGAWDASDFDDTQVMEEMPTPMPAADMSGVVTPLPSVMSRRFKYSTTEQVVGEWIDGKPLYQRVITGLNFLGSSASGSWHYITDSQTDFELNGNIDIIVDAAALRTNDNLVFRGCAFRYNKISSRLEYCSNISFASCNMLILQYTKTTDTPV